VSLHSIIVGQPRPVHLRLSDAQWNTLLAKVQSVDSVDSALEDEAAWTFLCAYGYAAVGSGNALGRCLCETEVPECEGDLWLEGEPIPPREVEGNTMVDLATGHIRARFATKSGIEFDAARAGPASWVLMVECKWLSDMSPHTTYDPLRGQLLRVVENALTLQAEGLFPDAVHVALVTPGVFRRNPRSRGYGPIFEAYRNSPRLILEDLASHSNPVSRGRPDWAYPQVDARIGALKLHWVDYEAIIERMPASQFKAELLGVAQRTGSLLQLG
jgi:hypothetical protein